MSAVSFATTGEAKQKGNGRTDSASARRTSQEPNARQMALIRRAVDAAWAKCRKAKSLRELAACIDARPYPVNEVMRAQLLHELSQAGIQATWRDVKEGKAAAEALIARLLSAQPGKP